MRISLSGVTGDSIVDGPGLRLTIFTQAACTIAPAATTHRRTTPRRLLADTEDILAAAAENPLLDGITLSGGDPFLQPVPCLALAEGAHKIGLNVWTYTGYTWEALLEENDAEKLALLKETDVLVDGPFLLAERSLELRFCGSRNQRLIDVKKSLAEDKVVLWEEPSYF